MALVVLFVVAGAGIGYVGYHALQEDTTMGPRSPLSWFLVDTRLLDLEPPAGCAVKGYWATVGDGPKLPGSDVTLVCRLALDAAERWARAWLEGQGFAAQQNPSWWSTDAEPPHALVRDGELADYHAVSGKDGLAHLRISISSLP